jgi:hypothetical protein
MTSFCRRTTFEHDERQCSPLMHASMTTLNAQIIGSRGLQQFWPLTERKTPTSDPLVCKWYREGAEKSVARVGTMTCSCATTAKYDFFFQ